MMTGEWLPILCLFFVFCCSYIYIYVCMYICTLGEKNRRRGVSRYPIIYSFKMNKEGTRTRRKEVIILVMGLLTFLFKLE